ncbi:hypothetical protein F7725_008874 [Dissostichus mawsoni]|uniref:Uncharacterized protein n=1 Tax=Dissostichus mawsoni TaxID=36200 RepID=A0A7J5Z5G7_DISMA|nr:hypothetical protein F7725_008874 [Dissostichus mawsoni]
MASDGGRLKRRFNFSFTTRTSSLVTLSTSASAPSFLTRPPKRDSPSSPSLFSCASHQSSSLYFSFLRCHSRIMLSMRFHPDHALLLVFIRILVLIIIIIISTVSEDAVPGASVDDGALAERVVVVVPLLHQGLVEVPQLLQEALVGVDGALLPHGAQGLHDAQVMEDHQSLVQELSAGSEVDGDVCFGEVVHLDAEVRDAHAGVERLARVNAGAVRCVQDVRDAHALQTGLAVLHHGPLDVQNAGGVVGAAVVHHVLHPVVKVFHHQLLGRLQHRLWDGFGSDAAGGQL